MSNLWWVGAIGSFLATACNTLGVNMQKMSANEEAALSPGERRPYFQQKTWGIGMFLIVCGSLGDFVSLSITAQSIVAPIKASALVTNLAIANIYLGEELSRHDFFGCIFIVAGSLFSVIFGSKESRKLKIDDLRENFMEIPFIGYALLVIAWSLFCEFWGRALETKRDAVEVFLEDLYVDDSESAQIMKKLKSNPDYIAAREAYAPNMKAHSFTYCSLAGTMGGQSLIFVKCVAELCRTTIGGDNQLIYPLTYIFLLCMAFFIVFQVHYLNKALIISDALFVVPVYQCFFISFSTIGGLIYYQEYSTFTLLNWIFSIVGLAVILFGVWQLASRQFDDLEIQFVSTDNILHGSTFEFETGHTMEYDEISDTDSARRVSISLRLQSSTTDLLHPGGVFTEIPTLSAPPMSRELIHGTRALHRALTPSRSHLGRTLQRHNSMPMNVKPGSLDSNYRRTSLWKIVHDVSDSEDMSLSSQTANYSETPSRAVNKSDPTANVKRKLDERQQFAKTDCDEHQSEPVETFE